MIKQKINYNDWILEANYPSISLKKWQRMINLMAEVCDAPAAFIVQYTSNGYQISIASETKTNPYDAGEIITNNTNIFCKKVVTENQSLYVRNATSNPEWADNPEVANDRFNSYLGAPIHWPDGSIFGTCCVMDFTITDYQKTYINLVHEFAEIIERDLELLTQYRELETQSLIDELTGLYNRRGFMTMAPEKINLAQRYEHGVGILYCDLDKLKTINDEHGHDMGDQALIKVANVINETIRKSDLAARLGGDEFVALLFMKNQHEIEQIADRLQETIHMNSATDLQLTLSLGHAYYDINKTYDIEEMLKKTDKLMYENKRNKTTK